MSKQSPQEEEVVTILEEKLKELRFNYEDELGKLMEEIKADTEASGREETEEKIAQLHSQLGL